MFIPTILLIASARTRVSLRRALEMRSFPSPPFLAREIACVFSYHTSQIRVPERMHVGKEKKKREVKGARNFKEQPHLPRIDTRDPADHPRSIVTRDGYFHRRDPSVSTCTKTHTSFDRTIVIGSRTPRCFPWRDDSL